MLPYGRILDDYLNLIHIFLAPMEKRADELVLGEGREVQFFGSGELLGKVTPHVREILAHFFSGAGARRE